MKVLVIGGGGREHAICWKLSQSDKVTELFCAPGNGGISKIATCVPVSAMDKEGILNFAVANKIDMVMVAPDDPLSIGMVDYLEAAGIKAFGPCQAAAKIEASKVFSKGLMKKYGIPTAEYETFTDSAKAIEYLHRPSQTFPAVIKADGLALGKGVIIAKDMAEAEEAVKDMIDGGRFGASGAEVVIEEFMTGPEATVLAFTDGETIYPMVSSQDHKRAYDNDEGPNTGGMGAFSPSRNYTEDLADVCMKTIFKPTIEALKAEGIKYKGVIYFGLMLTPNGPKVVEYNSRFGDPETQCILPRLKTDLYEIFDAVIEERLSEITIEWDERPCCCIVAASGGYPVDYKKGYVISGIEDAEKEDTIVFHAGTGLDEDGNFVNKGGRVLGITAFGTTLDEAIEKAYKGTGKISWTDMHYRKDIGRA
ncbi:MAG: phosphoribosylamine--glycine ligase [Ruminococcaceae bacterium]|nr:phosphoribosylamine--glycine ligase [Oscillospiraceae bacterium]